MTLECGNRGEWEVAGGDGDALGRRMIGDCVRIWGGRRGETREQKWWRWRRGGRRWCWRGNQGSTANLSGGGGFER